jgi:hypothetical protein
MDGTTESRYVIGDTTMEVNVNDSFDFTPHPKASYLFNLFEEYLPGDIAYTYAETFAGTSGTDFNLAGSFEYEFDTYATQTRDIPGE